MSILPNGVYNILNGDKFAINFPGTGTHPPFITGIMYGSFSGAYSEWAVRHVGEGAYSISNSGSRHHAYVKSEEEGASIDGNSDKGVHFVIERAGGPEYVIKTVNRDFDWTVKEDPDQPGSFHSCLSASGQGPSQHFRFEFVKPILE